MMAARPDPALADIRAAVARGMADVEAGRTIDAAEAFAELEAYFRRIARGDAGASIPVTGGDQA
jgi:hypothetical protein